MQYKLSGLALCALAFQTTVAAPSAHRRHRHERRMEYDNPNWETEVNWATVNYGGGAEASATAAADSVYAAAPAVTSAAEAYSSAAAPAVTPSSQYAAPSASASASSGSTGSYEGGSSGGSSSGGGDRASSSQQCTAFKKSSGVGAGFGGMTAPIGSGDTYIGNVGCPYASNIQLVDSTDGYQYTNTFKSTASSDRDIIVWLKAAPSSPTTPNTGQYGEPAMSFTLKAGGSQVVAFDQDTQPVFCDWTEKQKNADGSYKCAYGEADYGSSINNGWGGFDVSNIQNDGGACGLSLEAAGQSSSCTSNVYSDINAAIGGIGGNIAPGLFNLVTTVSD